jgi:23S rRNA (guanosine2251-2'-O)-methyltransferase
VERRRLAFDLDDAVYGIHSISEAIAAGDALRCIYVSQERKGDAALRGLLERAKERDLPVRFESHRFFGSLPVRAHQGVFALAPPFAYRSLSGLLAAQPRSKHRLLVVLDHLTDPHNVGAILRTAECAGADGLILPERRGASINATVRKAAAGAAAHLPVARVPNVAQAIRSLKKAGIWVAGADAGSGAVEMAQADFDRDLALVIGAEGAGLSPLVKRECDYLVRIPLRGQVASLNASVATGVLLYEALRQRGCFSRA